jgi:hypothetical protein
MEIIFNIIAGSLHLISHITGFSYEEINILIYYFIIPYSYLVIIDYIFNFHFLKILFVITVFILFLAIHNFYEFSNFLFHKSLEFLNIFYPDFTYEEFSVIICVIIPLIIYFLLIFLAQKRRNNMGFNQ